MNSDLNFRQLIDLAIGSPEPGHVNFCALHLLLYSFAEKLNIINDPVDSLKYENDVFFIQANKASPSTYSSFLNRRMHAGADPEAEEGEGQGGGEGEGKEPGPEGEIEAAVAEEAPAQADVLAEPVEPADEPGQTEIAPESQQLDELQQPDAGMERASSTSVELEVQGAKVAEEVYRGVAIMKDQIELVMEQVHLLIDLAVNNKSSQARTDQLRSLCKKMLSIQKKNIYIDNAFGFRISYTMFEPNEEIVEEEIIEEEVEESEPQPSDHSIQSVLAPVAAQKEVEEYDLDLHLVYSPEKLLDQLVDLKSEFCMLTNKVNEISASMLDQDCQRTTMILKDLQDQMKDVKFFTSNLKESQERIDFKTSRDAERIESLTHTLEEVMTEKIDKSEIEILLADKVDYNQLQRKVSQEQIQEMHCRLEKQFCEVHKVIDLNEKKMFQVMENMRTSLGLASVDDILRRFKEKIEHDIHTLQATLREYIDATNDENAAAGARIKVLQDLACLSCDTTCVMRTVERAKVAKLPSAHTTNTLGPLITYELGSIRKSGVMGYYRKDEFPHAPNAWMNRQNVNMKSCVARHAGGPHTTYTAKDHVEKVLMPKK